MTNAQLAKFLEDARNLACSVAHIQSPHRSGKSTELVPYIWSVVRGDPDTRMFYIQPTRAQTTLLREYLQSQDAGIFAAVDKRLAFLAAPVAAVYMLTSMTSPLRHKSVVVCMDLDVVPTACGEFLLACLVERVTEMHMDGASGQGQRLVVITLGAGPHRFPPGLQPSVVEIRVVRSVQLPDAQVVNYASDLFDPTTALARSLASSGNGIVLSIMTGDLQKKVADMVTLAMQLFAQTTGQATTAQVNIRKLKASMLCDPPAIKALLGIRGPAIVQVDPTIAVTLPFRDIRAVFFGTHQLAQALDGRRGLYLYAHRLSSQSEIDVYRAYTASGPVAAQSFQVSIDDVWWGKSAPGVPPSRAYNFELILLALFAICKWRGRISKMPLARLGPCDPTKWLEAVYKLKLMGMIAETGDEATSFVITPLGNRALYWLPYNSDWRVALLLGHMTPKMSDQEKRVIIRLAAIIDHEVPLALPKYMSPGILRNAIQTARGPATSMLQHGHLWVTLSEWERVRRGTDNFTSPSVLAYPLRDGRLGLTRAREILDRVVALEHREKVPLASAADLDQPLGPDGELRVQRALADAWLSNLLWIPKGFEWDVITLAHGDSVEIDEQVEVLVLDDLLDEHGLYAIALDLTAQDRTGTIAAWNTVLIDGPVLKQIIVERLGSLIPAGEAFAAVYAHGAR